MQAKKQQRGFQVVEISGNDEQLRKKKLQKDVIVDLGGGLYALMRLEQTKKQVAK